MLGENAERFSRAEPLSGQKVPATKKQESKCRRGLKIVLLRLRCDYLT